MSGPLLLGVDGGGTSTTAWLGAVGGRVLGRGRSGPSNAKAVGADAARGAIDAAIGAAFADAAIGRRPADVACLGLAGFDRPADRATLGDWAAGWSRRLVLVNDGELVLAAGTPANVGVAVIAGTGSIVVGRSADGRTARAGGWGPLIGDEGSAYRLVLDALSLVAASVDGRFVGDSGPIAILSDRLCDALGVPGPREIVTAIYRADWDRTRLAGLAPVVLDAARDDGGFLDARLLDPHARPLAPMVAAVARRLGLGLDAGGAIPTALAGSFLLAAPVVRDGLVDELGRLGLAVRTAEVPEPVVGALILAEGGVG